MARKRSGPLVPPRHSSATSRRPRQKCSAPSKPLVRAVLAMSLDGYIADAQGGVDWLNPFFSPEIDFAGFTLTIGSAVMGRRTFDLAAAHSQPPPPANYPTIALTHRPLTNLPAGMQTYSGDVGQLIDRLRGALCGTGRDIWLMGGGRLLDAFRRARLIDRLELSVMPILLGAGIPLSVNAAEMVEALSLTHSRTLTNGVVELWYDCRESNQQSIPGSTRGPAR
jgi:dihydrofolate reductase